MPTLRLLLVPALALASLGAVDDCLPADTPGELALEARSIDATTQLGLFAVGATGGELPYAGPATLDPASLRASLLLTQSEPGRYENVRYAGYRSATTTVGGVTRTTYCQVDRGAAARPTEVRVGRRTRVTLSTLPVAGCGTFAADRVIVNPVYQLDVEHPSAGATVGDNLVTVVGQGLVPGTPVSVIACDGVACASPFGLFATLPDTPHQRWPALADWEDRHLELVADGAGTVVGYVLAKPGAAPALWELRLHAGALAAVPLELRVAQAADLELVAE